MSWCLSFGASGRAAGSPPRGGSDPGPGGALGVSLAAVLALSPMAAAQTPEPLIPPTVSAGPVTTRITAATCRRLVRHQPDPDVAYRPGVDAHGRPVAPADLYGGTAFADLIPGSVTFHIVLDALEAAGLTSLKGIETPGTMLGTITYDINRNTFALNGVPVDAAATGVLVGACRRGLAGDADPDGRIYPQGYDGPRLPGPKPLP